VSGNIQPVLAVFFGVVSALEKKSYDLSGRLLAYSIVHRGPLPSFLSETLYTTITCGYAAAQPGIQQVDDITLRQQLTAVSFLFNILCTIVVWPFPFK